MLTAEGLALLVLAAALGGPVPAALARARWPARSPRAALALWQAVGLGGGLAILGAGLTLAVSGLHRPWLGGLAALPGAVRAAALGPLGWAGAAITVIMGGWLGAVAVISTAALTLARRAHRHRLDLLADELRLDDQPVRLVEHPAATAYCLPGVRPRIVLSRGAVDVLSRAELRAVVTHEKAHARERHDLVIQPFRAWRQTFPFLAPARSAVAAVELLTELAADNAACRGGQREALAGALRALAAGGGHPLAGARADRLGRPRRPLPRLAAAGVCAAAAALLVVPAAVLLLS